MTITAAKIKAKLPTDGHGLTHRLCEAIYEARAAGRPTDDILVVARISPVGHAEEEGKRSVSFDIAALEVVAEEWERKNVRDILTNASDKRHGSTQLPLDFDSRNDDEKRRHLLGLIEDDWAPEQGLTQVEIGERWRTQWGIEGDEPSTDGAWPHPDYRKAAVHHLQEFAYLVGVLADGQATDDAAAVEDGCQVCSTPDVPLIDGLCADCAKTAGIPVPADDESAEPIAALS